MNAPAAVEPSATVNLLWTGGWDSTFQLLRLLLIHGRHVNPFYLQDATRPSTAIEIQTMDRIRDRLASVYPQTRQLLAPTRLFKVSELAEDHEINSAFRASVKQAFMGSQYAWLARFCRQQHITDMELCIHRDDKAHAAIEQYVVEDVAPGGYRTYRFDPQYSHTGQYTLFGGFSFPLFEMSKLDMAAVNDERGWKDLMHMTWFCHRPGKDQQPCGRCNPCLYTIEEGLGWRIPMGRRVTSAAYRIFVRPLKSPAKAILQRLQARSGD